jgi:hypothetical protein
MLGEIIYEAKGKITSLIIRLSNALTRVEERLSNFYSQDLLKSTDTGSGSVGFCPRMYRGSAVLLI